MIHEISPHKFDNQYSSQKVFKEDDYILYYSENNILLKRNGENLHLPQKKDFRNLNGDTDCVFLFTLNGVSCFLIWDELHTDGNCIIFQELNFFRNTKQQELAWVAIAGVHLRNWYLQNKYCGVCGSKMKRKADERALTCDDCDTTIYPKISPAIIVAIVSNDKILLARGTNFPGGWYSLIAGYVDVGESLEETVKREVKEEVGLDVWNIRYYKSQPWPLSSSMMIGFIAEADENQPLTIDEKEIAEAAWFKRGELPERPSNLSISGELINKFESGKL